MKMKQKSKNKTTTPENKHNSQWFNKLTLLQKRMNYDRRSEQGLPYNTSKIPSKIKHVIETDRRNWLESRHEFSKFPHQNFFRSYTGNKNSCQCNCCSKEPYQDKNNFFNLKNTRGNFTTTENSETTNCEESLVSDFHRSKNRGKNDHWTEQVEYSTMEIIDRFLSDHRMQCFLKN
eukprot:gb/GECH01009594.1/.p1 GENE.gb/GECH01009594.1/~~gb/GECH01009594.1/.p1  ORF type:complete len:176 (+),score=13.90 gb/GECH01009594.1/:1-528(+)